MYGYSLHGLRDTEHNVTIYVNHIHLTMAPVWPKHVPYFVRRRGIGSVSARNQDAALKTLLRVISREKYVF
jgi:hypothetical protein